MEYVELDMQKSETNVCVCPFCDAVLLRKDYFGEQGKESDKFVFDETPCSHVVFMSISDVAELYSCSNDLCDAASHVDDPLELFQETLKNKPQTYWFSQIDSGIACGPISFTWTCLVTEKTKTMTEFLVKLSKENREE